MNEIKVGQQYLVTNIKFKHSSIGTVIPGYQRFHDFKVPADVNEIHEWLIDYGTEITDKSAYTSYIRSILFYNFEMTYDFQLIKELPVPAAFQFGYPTYADLADHKYADYKPATVSIEVPIMHLCTLCADDIMFAGNDVEQAIFENLMHNLPIDVIYYTVTDLILDTMQSCMTELDAPDPDNIAQLALDSLYDGITTDQKNNELYDAVHNLASVLVKDIGKYM